MNDILFQGGNDMVDMDENAASGFVWYYAMAAKGIQDFILRGDKLKLMIGGSELIEELPNKVLTGIMEGMNLGVKDYKVLSRTAGGARVLFRDEQMAKMLALLMPIVVSKYAPGLDVVQDVSDLRGNEDGKGLAYVMEKAEKRMQERRATLFCEYPVAGPLVERTPRSGLPVVGMLHRGSDSRDYEVADAGMIAKENSERTSRCSLKRKVLDKEEEYGMEMARDFDDLAEEENSYVAIMHADANGLGKVVRGLLHEIKHLPDEQARETYESFCSAVGGSTERAVRAALRSIVEEVEEEGSANDTKLPFRALVCAGDDVTLVLRAKDAIAVAYRFLVELEKESKEALGKVGAECLSGTGLTSCAGIAFVKKSFPFAQAYHLCESLCRFAKSKTNREASALAYWRVKTTLATDVETVIREEIKTEDGTVLTMMPYCISHYRNLATIGDLVELGHAVKGMPTGSLRGLLSEMYRGKESAQRAFERLAEVSGMRDTEGIHGKRAFERLKKALSSITDSEGLESLWKSTGGQSETPLLDALELVAACGRKSPELDGKSPILHESEVAV